MRVKEDFYDITVPDTHNYVTVDGAVHHNSSKSTGCVMELMRIAQTTPPQSNGIRKSRFAVVRNTVKMLRDTTIKTFHDWVPPGAAGEWRSTTQTFHLKFGDVESEIMFRALDSADDARNVLSLELTHCWLNEFREIDPEVFQAMLGRVTRYPSRASVRERPRFGIIMDSNPPSVGSYWYDLCEGHIAMPKVSIPGLTGEVPLLEYFRQPGGRTPGAENVENLDPGYYDTLAALNGDRGAEWVRVHIDAEYGQDQANAPVFPDFRTDHHVSKTPLHYNPAKPLVLGFDQGRNAACVAMQHNMHGQWNIFAEFMRENCGFETFVDWLLLSLKARFPDAKQFTCFGDPAGNHRNDTDDKTCWQIARTRGLIVRPAMGSLELRLGAVRRTLSRFSDGRPGLLIDPSCRMLIKAFQGEYKFQRNQHDELAPQPLKNRFADIADAVQYGLVFYEGPAMKGASNGRYGSADNFNKPVIVRENYSAIPDTAPSW